MLILSRRVREGLTIGDSMIVKVLGVQYGQVRFGIEAPPTINIVRNELLTKEQINRIYETIKTMNETKAMQK